MIPFSVTHCKTTPFCLDILLKQNNFVQYLSQMFGIERKESN